MKLETNENHLSIAVENNSDLAFVKHELGLLKHGDSCVAMVVVVQGQGTRIVIRRAASAPEPAAEEKKA